MFNPSIYRMDSSDIIKRLRDKTVFYNIQVQFSIAQAAKNCVPTNCGPNGCSYSFPDYETRLEYFSGRYDIGSSCSTCSTCTTFSFQ